MKFSIRKTPLKIKPLIFLCLLLSNYSQAETLAELYEQVEKQKLKLENQSKEIEHQKQQLDDLLRKLKDIKLNLIAAKPNSNDIPKVTKSTPQKILKPFTRDAIGDMRSETISEGSFPASIQVSGSKAPVQLAIGGFIKSVAYYDNHYERDDPYFFPALLGLGRDDKDGQFGMSAHLSRIYLDGRTDTGKGQLRGYIEMDFRDDITLRHAYIDWNGKYGQLKAGKYWSTFMDLSALTEGVTEPLVSGASLARQEQIRYTTSFSNNLTFAVAIESPSSNDILTANTPKTSIPDLITTLRVAFNKQSHIQFGGLYRKLDVNSNLISQNKATGWGGAISGRIELSKTDEIVYGVNYGAGIGRYLLGLDPFSAAYVDPNSSTLESREGKGGYISHAHHWSDDVRTNIMYGEAHAEAEDFFLPSTFKSSKYFGSNIFYEITPYLVFGLEYAWGERLNVDGNAIDNQRITFGIQLF